MKPSNIVRKQARRRCWNKAGCWRVKIILIPLSCDSQADVMLFVGKLHRAHLFQIDSDLVLSDATATQGSRSSWMRLGQRSRRLSKVSSLMLKPHRPSWLPSSHPHRLPKGCPGVGRKYFRTSCSSSSLFQALNCTQRGPKPSSDGYGATWREPEPVFPEVCLNSMAHHGTCCSARPQLMGLDCDILPCLPHRS